MRFIVLIFILFTTLNAEDLTLGKKGWDLTQAGKHKEAIELFKQCIKEGNLTKESTARTYRNIGIAYRRDLNPTEAIKYFNKSIILLPNDIFNDLTNRGNCFSDLNDYDAALADYALAEAINPNEGEVNYNRGIVFGRMKDEAKTIEQYKIAYNKGLRTPLLLEQMKLYKIETK